MEPNLAQLNNNNSTQAIHNLAQPQHNQLKPSLNTSALTIFIIPNTDPQPDQKMPWRLQR